MGARHNTGKKNGFTARRSTHQSPEPLTSPLKMTPSPTSKQVVGAFFKPSSPSSQFFQCECGKREVKGQKNEYTNLMNQLQNHYHGHPDVLARTHETEKSNILAHFKPKKEKLIHGWFMKVILLLQPISILEDYTERYTSSPTLICLRKLLKLMNKMVPVAETKMINWYDQFALIFDGSSAVYTQYLPIFAYFQSINEKEYLTYLLKISSLGHETTLDVQEH